MLTIYIQHGNGNMIDLILNYVDFKILKFIYNNFKFHFIISNMSNYLSMNIIIIKKKNPLSVLCEKDHGYIKALIVKFSSCYCLKC